MHVPVMMVCAEDAVLVALDFAPEQRAAVVTELASMFVAAISDDQISARLERVVGALSDRALDFLAEKTSAPSSGETLRAHLLDETGRKRSAEDARKIAKMICRAHLTFQDDHDLREIGLAIAEQVPVSQDRAVIDRMLGLYAAAHTGSLN